jgi:conjugal transfer pilus assembly protein TraK
MLKSFMNTLLMLFVLTSSAFGLQIRTVSDNQTVMIKVSAKELSRIFVSGDRILNVRGLDGAYDLKRDDTLGEIYVQPSPYFQHKAFNLFITTEKGHTYNLFATPLEIPAESIQIKPKSPTIKLADRWERNSAYGEVIIKLMEYMKNEKYPEGYAVVSLGKVKPKKISSALTMQLLTIYKGDHLQGEIWLVKNVRNSGQYVHPRDFYQNDVRAVSIIDENLLPACETLVYRVVDHD